MWTPHTSPWLSWHVFHLHALSGDLCLIAEVVLLWMMPNFGHHSENKVDAVTMSMCSLTEPSPHQKENVPGKPGLTALSHALTCCALDLSPAAVISCMRSASREHFGTWVAMSERLAGPDAKAPWRPKTEIEKNCPCSSKGTCPPDTKLNPRQCLLKSQTSNRRSSLPAVAALLENHLFSVL